MDQICSILRATYCGECQYGEDYETQIVVMSDDGTEQEEVDVWRGERISTDATKRK